MFQNSPCRNFKYFYQSFLQLYQSDIYSDTILSPFDFFSTWNYWISDHSLS